VSEYIPVFGVKWPSLRNLVSVGLMWSDEDVGDETEDRRTSSQAIRECENWPKCEPRWNFEDNPGGPFDDVVAKLVC